MATKKKKTAINYVIVDDSGSMSRRANDVKTGLIGFISKLQNEVPDSILVVIYFGSNYQIVYRGTVRESGTFSYSPNQGYTALWAAYGRGIDELMQEQADYKSITLITDGADNFSERCGWSRHTLVSHAAGAVSVARAAGITVGLLATGVDTFGIAKQLGIDPDLVSEYKPEEKGVERAMTTYGGAVTRSSQGGRAALTTLERAAIDESPEEIAAKNGEELVTLNKAAKLLQSMYEKDVNQFFSVTFKKRTPPYKNRTYAKARFHVVSKMVGASGAGAAYNFLEKALVPCWVMDLVTAAEAKESKGKYKEGAVHGFKSIPLDGILALRAGGKAYRVKTGG